MEYYQDSFNDNTMPKCLNSSNMITIQSAVSETSWLRKEKKKKNTTMHWRERNPAKTSACKDIFSFDLINCIWVSVQLLRRNMFFYIHGKGLRDFCSTYNDCREETITYYQIYRRTAKSLIKVHLSTQRNTHATYFMMTVQLQMWHCQLFILNNFFCIHCFPSYAFRCLLNSSSCQK